LVIQFDLSGRPRQSYWLLVEHTNVSICLKSPGFDIDVIVSADVAAFYQVWLGRVTLAEALRKQQVRLEGRPLRSRFLGLVCVEPDGGYGSRWFDGAVASLGRDDEAIE
jgi:hypothetical protein